MHSRVPKSCASAEQRVEQTDKQNGTVAQRWRPPKPATSRPLCCAWHAGPPVCWTDEPACRQVPDVGVLTSTATGPPCGGMLACREAAHRGSVGFLFDGLQFMCARLWGAVPSQLHAASTMHASTSRAHIRELACVIADFLLLHCVRLWQHLRRDPRLIHTPQLAFFATYVRSLGATLPTVRNGAWKLALVRCRHVVHPRAWLV